MITWGYLFSNYISASASITPSTEDATYTKASLYDRRINKPFRFTSKSSQSLLFDLFSSYEADIVILLKHNFTPSATITLKGGATSAANNFSVTIPWASTNTYKQFTAPSGYRYYKLEVDDPTNSRNPELGEMYLHSLAQFNRAYSWGSEEGRVFNTDQHRTEFGTIVAYPKYNIRTRRFPLSPLNASQKQEIHDMIATASGGLFPIVIIPDTSGNDCIFGRITDPYGATASPPPYYTAGFGFAEESSGKAVT